MSDKINTPNIDTVYHITDLAHLSSIEDHGLISGAGELEVMRGYVDEVVDGFRPEELVARGISRTDGIYAHPSLERLHRGSLRGRELDQLITLSVEVDPDAAMVLDAARLKDVALGIRYSHRNGVPERAARWYWDSAITLSEYRKLYNQSNGVRLNNSLDGTHPPFYKIPEVLIPDPVGPEKVSWVASILGKKSVALATK
ncbi:MAG: hypothetical protein U0451_01040 [Candidatus Saccharimonadales bacterium]